MSITSVFSIHKVVRALAVAFRSRLARRMVMWSILSSSILSLAMTGIQLAVDYHADRASLFSAVSKIKTVMLPGLTESFWILDDSLIQSQLQGLVQSEGIAHAEILESNKALYQSGVVGSRAVQTRDIPMTRQSNGALHTIGTLRVTISFDAIYKRLLRRGFVLFSSNTIKAFIVALLMLGIFHWLVGRHLVTLARFAETNQPGDKPQKVVLDRMRGNDERDELTDLQHAINRWTQANHAYLTDLNEANREQSEFTYAISHDLKSPINTLEMLLFELHSQEGSHFSDDSRQMFGDIMSTTERMKELIKDILAYAQTVGQKQKVALVELHSVLEDVLADLAGEITAADATINLGVLPCINANSSHIRALFQNLISNAIKFHHPERKPEIAINASPIGQGHWEIKVIDNGIGIPEIYSKKVFGMFQRLHNYDEYPGTGLGLTICRRIVTNHGGSISVCATAGGGSTFTMEFPEFSND